MRKSIRRTAARALLTCMILVALAGLARAQQTEIGAVQEPGPQLELTLLEAVEIALRHNLQVQVSRYQTDLSFEDVRAARAPYDPQISFNLPQSFQRSTAPQAGQLGGADILTQETFAGGFNFDERLEWGTQWNVSWNGARSVSNSAFARFNPSFSSNLSFNVNQPLLRDFGSVNRTQILVARNSYEGSLEQFRGQVQSIILSVYEAYWDLVAQIDTVRVRRESLQLTEEQLERNRVQLEVGTLAPIETIQAEQANESAELQLIQAENAQFNAQDRLKQLLNIEVVHPASWDVQIVPVDAPETTFQDIDVEEAIDTALANDPRLRQQRVQVQNARLNLRLARNQLLPRLDFNGALSLSGVGGDQIIRGGLGGDVSEIQEGSFTDALQQVLSGDFNAWSVGLQLSFPLHNYAAAAQHARASIAERQSATQLQALEQQTIVDVRTALRNLRNGARAVAAAQETTRLTQEQLDAEIEKFDVGASTNFQVLTFQDRLAAARLQELQAIVQFNVARAQFEQAKGTLLESLGVTIQDAGRGAPRTRQ